MNLSRIAKGSLLGLALFVATNARAGSKDSFKVSESVTVNGTKLNAGDYQLKWEGTGPDIELMILKSNKVLITVPARLAELSQLGENSSYVTRTAADGSAALTEIRLPKKKYSLMIGQQAGAEEPAKDGSQR